MNARLELLPQELEDRLIEWARFFKDRHKYMQCGSLESNFTAYRNLPGARDEGWDSPGAPERVLPAVVVPRAIQTNDAIVALPERVYRWVITYHYCFPGLERWRILKAIRKYSGRRLNWKEYGEALDIARIR